MRYAVAVHVLAAAIWVGGMFFAYVVLRPSAAALDASARLVLWRQALGRFFAWVWVCLAALLASGFAMLFLGFGGLVWMPSYARLMMVLGILMGVIFAYVYFAPWRDLQLAIAAGDATGAQSSLGEIRLLVGINLLLGLLTLVVGASGPYI